MNRTVYFIILFCFAGYLLSAQEEGVPDSLSMRFMDTFSPFVHPNTPLILPEINTTLPPEFQKKDDFPKSWNGFKAAFLALPLPEEFAMMERLHKNMELGKQYPPSLWLSEEEIIRNNGRHQLPVPGGFRRGYFYTRPTQGGVSFGVAGLFQELYDLYSHEGKMKRKYDHLVQQDNIHMQVAKKYDIALVKRVTGFDDTTAQEFMDFCDFKSDSILQANQYDVYNMIYDCLSQFMNDE